ncbi:hypothetical protein CEQ90_17255 [Lewinellaceae bacterium SD302]|nr:hypothetical protein CEQ90_17255 [Lewinellaceae bacterium SD302]
MYLIVFLLQTLALFSPADVISKAQEAEPDQANVFLSTDAGCSWEYFTKGLPAEVDPYDFIEHRGELIMITRAHGIYRLALDNQEGGWQSSNVGLPSEIFLISILTDEDYIAVGSFMQGIFVSQDGGHSWRRPVFNLKRSVKSLIFHNGELLAATDYGLYVSHDRGESWTERGDFPPLRTLHLHEGKLIAARQNNIGIIEGDQATWSDLETDWAIGDLTSHDGYLYIRTAGDKIFRSKDGLEWETPTASCVIKHNLEVLPEALWSGLDVKLPGGLDPGAIRATSIGWLTMGSTGC